MRTYGLALPCLILVLLLAPSGVRAEPDPKMYDSYAPIGPDAKRDMMALIRIYDDVLGHDMHVQIAEAWKELGESEFLLDANGALGSRAAFRGGALMNYRNWVAKRGGDASKIKDLPDDWKDLEAEYYECFKIMQVEGDAFFKEFYALAVDGSKIEDFVWQDDLRLDVTEEFARRVDKEIDEARKLLAAYVGGRNTTDAAKQQLKRHRDQLVRDRAGLANRLDVLVDILKRAKDYGRGDAHASKRVPKVQGLYDAMAKLTHDKCGPMQSMAVELWQEDVTSVLDRYDECQRAWLGRLDLLVNKHPFAGTKYLDVSPDKYFVPIDETIRDIDDIL